MGQDQSTGKGVDGKLLQDPHGITKSKPPVNQIVVVSGKAVNKPYELVNDEDIQCLRKNKLSQPILKNLSMSEIEFVKLPRIISGPMTEMILRYQFHLTECAEAVSFDQGALTKQVKETDALALKLHKNLNDKHKSIEKVMSQIETVNEVSNMLHQIETNLHSVIKLFITLNKKLPMEEQIYDVEFA